VKMRNKLFITIIMLLVFCLKATASSGDGELLVLAYHDIPKFVWLDSYGVDRQSFVEQIEYLRAHGYSFVSIDEVIKASQGEKQLPPKPVLLTFDDAYVSYNEFVRPVLSLYGIPSVVAAVTMWIENKPPPDIKAPVMDWKQLKEAAEDPLVEVASHTHDLHRGIVYNPQMNTGPAVTSRIYDAETGGYESDSRYRKRLRGDFDTARAVLKEKLGVEARAIVWPYGEYNMIAVEEAENAGFNVMFAVENTPADIGNLRAIHRLMIQNNPPIDVFAEKINQIFNDSPMHQRILHVDLDMLYDPDPARLQANLDRFIERVYKMKVRGVYLQAFSDVRGNGNIVSVYFPNRVLPMRADFFSYVVNQLAIRGIEVYAWMPMMSIVLPDREENERLRVREYKNNVIRNSRSWYRRLSPFSKEAREKIALLYEDMAKAARIKGVIFNDDGYLNEYEDFHPEALKKYREHVNKEPVAYEKLTEGQKSEWMMLKEEAMTGLEEELKQAVRLYRPEAVFVRTLYSDVLMHPHGGEWFTQDYELSLDSNDYVAVMAYPYMEGVSDPENWLRRVVRRAEMYPGGLDKTVFKIQAYDWSRKRWISSKRLDGWLRALVAEGALHLAYYPDNSVSNKPEENVIRRMMSAEDFPYKRR
jgi:poly-beta-1,6-N-acetyl-D-glucosamine N-deacetylase